MNRLNLTDEQIAEWLAACEAWAKGKVVQFQSNQGSWVDWVADTEPRLTGARWRIKPEPVTVTIWAIVDDSGKTRDCYFCEPSDAARGRHGPRLVKLTGEFTTS